jgi:hypothetical protein
MINILKEIKTKVSAEEIKVSTAIAKILPELRGKASDDVLIWCSNELQGYQNGIDFYRRRFTDLPPYRVVSGVIKIIMRDGQSMAINHPIASRNEYFLSAPIGWLEDFYSVPRELSVVELPELTAFLAKDAGGTIVCQCTKTQLKRIMESIRESFLLILEKEIQTRSSTTPTPKAIAPQSFVPPTLIESSETPFTRIRAKALQLMKEAHSDKNWIIPTTEVTANADPVERQYAHAAIDFILKMGWGRQGNSANVFLLTDEGAKELTQATREFDKPK